MPFSLRFDPVPFLAPYAGGDDVTLTLREATAEDTASWVLDWRPRFRASLDPAVRLLGSWPVPEHFARSATESGRLCLVAVHGPKLEAFLSLTFDESRLTPGAPTLYVEYIGVGPDNLAPPVGTKAIQGLGSWLVSRAAAFAEKLGLRGRLGLHSKPESENFYRKLRLTEVGMEDVADGTWLSFELTPEVAAGLIERGQQ